MELFVIIGNGFQPLTIITKCCTLDIAAVLDPPLFVVKGNNNKILFQLTLKVHTISSVYIIMYGTYKDSYSPLEYANQVQLSVKES